ncbi:MAG: hypothetical protein OXT08_05730 [Candidatus Marinimicrobia bacterium]|nr:hypothetical protein [Candidatus Neomarinimicrobiota bacterium]
MLFRRSISVFGFSMGVLIAGDLYIFGTFDFNKNGKSEILKLNGLVAPLELVELDDAGNHQTLWSYSPPPLIQIVDAKFGDLNKDDIPELVVAQQGDSSGTWLTVFEWNGAGFSPTQSSIVNLVAGEDKIRPSNLASYSNIFAASMSTPTRSASVFSLGLNKGVPEKYNDRSHSSPLVSNGFGPIYVGLFAVAGEGYAGLVSPEGNALKASIFTLSNPSESIHSDILVTNGARVILGPDIQPFDENKDGAQELLIPFATGEVFALAISDSGITLTESRLSQSGLFGMKSGAGEAEINQVILSRIESGLYEPPLGIDQSSVNDSLLLLVEDTLMLGDTLNLFLLPDSGATFFHFNWEATPPPGMLFNPKTYSIEWIPTRDHIGVVDVSFALDIRLKETLISDVDSLGDTHQIHPVLQSHDSSFVMLVGDTIKPPEPFVLLPTRYHRAEVTSKDIAQSDRFTFVGETPFSTTSMNTNGIITVGVSANLSTIKQNKSGSFAFQSSAEKPDSIITLSLSHDLSSNSFYATLYPAADSVAQSFDPEGWQPSLYPYPEYFFEGFPNTMAIDSSAGGLSLLSSDEKMSGRVTIYSPLLSQDHGMTISYFGGRPHAIRGDINVQENGSHKTLTEIDFESTFRPLNISTWLSPVSRDTFVFHADSLPDTLKAKVDYRSFYAPAKVLENLTPTTESGVGSETVADTLQITEQPDSLSVNLESPPPATTPPDSTK